MASWERDIYAYPGQFVYWDHSAVISRPLCPATSDDVDEICRIQEKTMALVIACFPDDSSRGAIIMLQTGELWWWTW